MKFNTNIKLSLGFGVQILLASILGISVLVGLANVKRQFQVVVEHDTPIIANARHLSKLVVDMETGQRGFLITGKDEFLQPYHEGMTDFEKILAKEKDLVRDNPAQGKVLEQIENLVDEWQDKVAKPTIAMRRRSGIINAEQLLAEYQRRYEHPLLA